jgi:hypothetical protein
MATWTALVWNMSLGSPSPRNGVENWKALSKLMEERSVDVALLNEASTALLKKARDAALLNDLTDPVVYSEAGTIGRDRNPNGKLKTRRWSTAVLSPHGPRPIREDDVRAVSSDRSRSPDIPFGPSRPGSWTAARVPLDRDLEWEHAKEVTCISLYGLIEELSDASVHRSLSEISPIFSDDRYKQLVLLGGDLNTSTAWPDHDHRVRDEGVLQRIKAYGLVDCLKQTRKPGRLKNCKCVFGEDCQHTWTRLDPNQKRRPRTPYQMDYMFASLPLAKRLTSCEAIPPEEWQEYSDHSPIIATFD